MWFAAASRLRIKRAGTPATMVNGSTSSVNDGARADDGALADGHAGQHDGVDANVRPCADAHRPDRQVGLNDRYVCRHAGVRRAQDLRAGSPADGLLDDQVAGVEIALRTDPDVIADHAAAVEAALQILPARR